MLTLERTKHLLTFGIIVCINIELRAAALEAEGKFLLTVLVVICTYRACARLTCKQYNHVCLFFLSFLHL